MRWPWNKRERPEIPPYRPFVVDERPKPKEPAIIVEEIDTKDMSATGVFRAWKKLTGKRD